MKHPDPSKGGLWLAIWSKPFELPWTKQAWVIRLQNEVEAGSMSDEEAFIRSAELPAETRTVRLAGQVRVLENNTYSIDEGYEWRNGYVIIWGIGSQKMITDVRTNKEGCVKKLTAELVTKYRNGTLPAEVMEYLEVIDVAE